MSNKHQDSIDDVLDALMLQETEPSHAALMRWCAQYPEHREALSHYFATWAAQDELPERVAVDEEQIARRMVSHALNILHRQNAATSATPEPAAVPRLNEAIVSNGLTEGEFARRCGFDESITLKLDRRLIPLASIPRVGLERMSAALDRCVKAVADLLAGPPILLRSHKARGQPEAKVEDFLEAVRASDLPDEAKSEWSRVVAAERSSEGYA